MRSVVEDTMKIAIIISSLKNCNKCAPIIALVNSMKEEMVTWNHVATVFVEENKRLISRAEPSNFTSGRDGGYLAQSSRTVNGPRQNTDRRVNTATRKIYGVKPGHIARNCRLRPQNRQIEKYPANSRAGKASRWR